MSVQENSARPSGVGSTKATNTPSQIFTAEEWLTREFDKDETEPVLGTADQRIVRPFTKNIIEAPEKSFKTTFLLRLSAGMACGQTVFPALAVSRPLRVLYLHGELSPPEIKERTEAAAQGLCRPLEQLLEGRDLRLHLTKGEGPEVLKKIVAKFKPEVLVIDPWQSFIVGIDENQFRDVSSAMHFLDKLIEDYHVTVFIATHMGKDRSRGTRGHSSLAGWRDTLIKLERPGSSRDTVKVSVESRWSRPVDPFNLRFDKGTLVPTEVAKFTPQAEQIRKCVSGRGGKATKQQVGECLGQVGDTLRQALGRAEKAGAINITNDEITLPIHPSADPLEAPLV